MFDACANWARAVFAMIAFGAAIASAQTNVPATVQIPGGRPRGTPPAPGGAADWVVTPDWNAVPLGSGAVTSQKSADDCEASCTGSCNQFSFNARSGHCYTSDATVVTGEQNPRVVSGCRRDRCTAGCGSEPGPSPGPGPAPGPSPAPGKCSFDATGLYCALSFDEGASWDQRRVITDDFTRKGHTVQGFDGRDFTMSFNSGEPDGYNAAAVSDDGMIHLITSRNHYQFNLAWLRTLSPAPPPEDEE